MPDLPPLFHRHDILYLHPDAELHGEAADLAIVREWARADRPVIVCRPGTTAAGIHCGLPLPSPQGRRRIAFVVQRAGVRRRSDLPRWSECQPRLPASHPCRGLELPPGQNPRVFGSLAWETMTGLPYLHDDSDLDVLWEVGTPAELRRLPQTLALVDRRSCDLEIMLWDQRAFSWREFCQRPRDVLVKTDHDVFLLPWAVLAQTASTAELAAAAASGALREELATYPKPGLVSHLDSGSHDDMDAGHFQAAMAALNASFLALAEAGSRHACFPELQRLGLAAEASMLAATGGVNTHRGAIFTLGLLVAATGFNSTGHGRPGRRLGELVRDTWGGDILALPVSDSHGAKVRHRHGVAGAREEAAGGFQSVYRHGLPAFQAADRQGVSWRNQARVQALFALLEHVSDTTIWHRGGAAGREFAVAAAREFNAAGGIHAPDWAGRAAELHAEFIRRRLTCGGVADLLAATIFLDQMEQTWLD